MTRNVRHKDKRSNDQVGEFDRLLQAIPKARKWSEDELVKLAHDASHLSTDQLSGYLDNSLDDADRANVETHVATCSFCLHQLAVASKLENQPEPLTVRSHHRVLSKEAAADADTVQPTQGHFSTELSRWLAESSGKKQVMLAHNPLCGVGKSIIAKQLSTRSGTVRESNEALLGAFYNGDDSAFDELHRRLRPRLLRSLRPPLASIDDVEDAFQDTMINVFVSRNKDDDRFDPKLSKVDSWISGFAERNVHDILEEQRRAVLFSASSESDDAGAREARTACRSFRNEWTIAVDPAIEDRDDLQDCLIVGHLTSLPERERLVLSMLDCDDSVRMPCLTAVGSFGLSAATESVRNRLVSLARDDDRYVRNAAAKVLCTLGHVPTSEISECLSHAVTLPSLAPHLSERTRAEVLKKALAAVREMPDGYRRALVMSLLSSQFREPTKSRILREASAAAREIADAHQRDVAMSAVSPHSGLPDRAPVSELDPASSKKRVWHSLVDAASNERESGSQKDFSDGTSRDRTMNVIKTGARSVEILLKFADNVDGQLIAVTGARVNGVQLATPHRRRRTLHSFILALLLRKLGKKCIAATTGDLLQFWEDTRLVVPRATWARRLRESGLLDKIIAVRGNKQIEAIVPADSIRIRRNGTEQNDLMSVHDIYRRMCVAQDVIPDIDAIEQCAETLNNRKRTQDAVALLSDARAIEGLTEQNYLRLSCVYAKQLGNIGQHDRAIDVLTSVLAELNLAFSAEFPNSNAVLPRAPQPGVWYLNRDLLGSDTFDSFCLTLIRCLYQLGIALRRKGMFAAARAQFEHILAFERELAQEGRGLFRMAIYQTYRVYEEEMLVRYGSRDVFELVRSGIGPVPDDYRQLQVLDGLARELNLQHPRDLQRVGFVHHRLALLWFFLRNSEKALEHINLAIDSLDGAFDLRNMESAREMCERVQLDGRPWFPGTAFVRLQDGDSP